MQIFQGIGRRDHLQHEGHQRCLASLTEVKRLFLLCLVEVGNGEILEKQHIFLF